jgi:hypothetical protein
MATSADRLAQTPFKAPSQNLSASNKSAETLQVSEERKNELLQSARRSRLKWVLEARDNHPIPALTESIPVPEEIEKKQTSSESKPNVQKLVHQIPAAQSVQEVLEFLNSVVNDGDNVDLDSILLTIQEEENLDNLFENWKSRSNSKSSYDVFIQKLLHPQAAILVKAIQQFITKFTTTLRRNRLHPGSSSLSKEPNTLKSIEDEIKSQTQSIWTFLDHAFEIMKDSSLWSEENPKDFEDSKLSCEKFVFTKLHSVLFGNDPNDTLLNQATSQRIESLSFITSEHLDIRSLQTALQAPGQQEQRKVGGKGKSESVDATERILSKPIDYLRRLQDARCPGDALTILKLCSQAIAQILKDCRRDGSLPGADELLPVMILAIKFANPPSIHSWIKYLQRYTRPSKLVSEAGYLITNFVSAVYFLDNVDANALTISPEEFEQSMKLSKLKAKERLSKSKNIFMDNKEPSSSSAPPSDERIEKVLADYHQKVKSNMQKEYVSIKATMSILQYGKI